MAKFKFASPIPEVVMPINFPDSLNKAPPGVTMGNGDRNLN